MPAAAQPSVGLTIRPVRPGDRDLIAAARDYTSADTYYRRFHSGQSSFTERELAYLTEVDDVHHVALIATEAEDPTRLVAVARFIRNRREPAEAEIAIIVHDPYQRQGIGRRMLTMLVTEARRRGIVRLRARVQTDNWPMIALLHAVLPGARVESRCDGVTEYVAPLSQAV